MTELPARPPRRRRIASDEAHSWARNLRLGNPHAKSVLRAIALYTNDEGACIAGLSTLAEDCDLSEFTVRKRLVFLEEIGAIARFANWVDDRGRRNGEGRGKRTTDEIRLLLDSDPEAIESRARTKAGGCDGHDAGEISPSQQQGLNPEPESVSPAPALRQPSDSADHLISEPEPYTSPQPPFGGMCEADALADQGKQTEPEHFQPFFDACLGWRTMARDQALSVFGALTADEQALARAAAPLHAAECVKFKRRSKDAHKLLRERFWERYPGIARTKAPDGVWIAMGSDQDRALRLICGLTDAITPRVRTRPDGAMGYWHPREVGPDLLAMLRYAADSPFRWPLLPRGSAEFAAWQERFAQWVRRPRREEPGEEGIRVPCRWPPKKDGTIYDDDAMDANQ